MIGQNTCEKYIRIFPSVSRIPCMKFKNVSLFKMCDSRLGRDGMVIT